MEPGARSCHRGPPSRVFLPFEGDETLSLILSKAFLRAADRKIADPSITRQLPVGRQSIRYNTGQRRSL
jgi:hypothetical protein